VEGAERILADDNTGGGTLMLKLIRLQCTEVCISIGLPSICIDVKSIPTCAKFDLRRSFRNVTTAQVGECLYVIVTEFVIIC